MGQSGIYNVVSRSHHQHEKNFSKADQRCSSRHILINSSAAKGRVRNFMCILRNNVTPLKVSVLFLVGMDVFSVRVFLRKHWSKRIEVLYQQSIENQFSTTYTCNDTAHRRSLFLSAFITYELRSSTRSFSSEWLYICIVAGIVNFAQYLLSSFFSLIKNHSVVLTRPRQEQHFPAFHLSRCGLKINSDQ